MGLEGSDPLEFGPAQDLLDLFQLQPQLPVEQDLLEGQKLRLLIEPVTIGPDIGGLEQTVSS